MQVKVEISCRERNAIRTMDEVCCGQERKLIYQPLLIAGSHCKPPSFLDTPE